MLIQTQHGIDAKVCPIPLRLHGRSIGASDFIILKTNDIDVLRVHLIHRPKWNDHHFADDIFIYLNENCCFFYSRLTEVIFLGFNFSTAALVQIMYCRLFGASNYACNGIINYVIHWWACLLTQICVIQPRWVNMALMGLALLYRCYFSQITTGHGKIGYLLILRLAVGRQASCCGFTGLILICTIFLSCEYRTGCLCEQKLTRVARIYFDVGQRQ